MRKAFGQTLFIVAVPFRVRLVVLSTASADGSIFFWNCKLLPRRRHSLVEQRRFAASGDPFLPASEIALPLCPRITNVSPHSVLGRSSDPQRRRPPSFFGRGEPQSKESNKGREKTPAISSFASLLRVSFLAKTTAARHSGCRIQQPCRVRYVRSFRTCAILLAARLVRGLRH